MVHTLPEDYLETETRSPAWQWYNYYWYLYRSEIHNLELTPNDRGYWDWDKSGEEFNNLEKHFGEFLFKPEVAHLAQQDVNSNFWNEGSRLYINYD